MNQMHWHNLLNKFNRQLEAWSDDMAPVLKRPAASNLSFWPAIISPSGMVLQNGPTDWIVLPDFNAPNGWWWVRDDDAQERIQRTCPGHQPPSSEVIDWNERVREYFEEHDGTTNDDGRWNSIGTASNN